MASLAASVVVASVVQSYNRVCHRCNRCLDDVDHFDWIGLLPAWLQCLLLPPCLASTSVAIAAQPLPQPGSLRLRYHVELIVCHATTYCITTVTCWYLPPATDYITICLILITAVTPQPVQCQCALCAHRLLPHHVDTTSNFPWRDLHSNRPLCAAAAAPRGLG